MNGERNIDDDLRAALRAEDAELLARIEHDPGMRDVILSGFKGSTAWWVFLTSCIQLILFGVAIWIGVRFLSAASVDDRVLWGVGLLLAWSAVGMIKLMIWNHVERNLILREVKALELQVATLSLRLQGQAAR